jgi:hypothetical protein
MSRSPAMALLTAMLTAPPLLPSAVGAPAPRVAAADPCAAFAWNVAHERALFATRPRGEVAGGAVGSAPLLSTDRLYRLTLSPQEQVRFAVRIATSGL